MPTTQQDRARFRQLDREQTRYEREWQPIIESAINEQIKPFITAVAHQGPVYALANIDSLISTEPMYRTLLALYKRVGTHAADSEWRYFQATYGAELRQEKAFGFNRIWAAIMEALFGRTGAEKVVGITDTERARLRKELELSAQDEQTTNKELAKRLESVDIAKARAKVIARTETAIAASEGGEAAASRTGVLMEKTWLSAQDNRTRHLPEDSADHLTMNGVSVRMDEQFLVPIKGGVEPMTRPHDPKASAGNVVMCRCKAVYKAVRDAAGRFIRVSQPPQFARQ